VWELVLSGVELRSAGAARGYRTVHIILCMYCAYSTVINGETKVDRKSGQFILPVGATLLGDEASLRLLAGRL